MTIGTILLGVFAGAVVLYVWNALCWMVLPHHHGDTASLGAAEEGVAEALRGAGTAPGWYVTPHMKDFEGGPRNSEFDARCRRGPNASVIVLPDGPCLRPDAFLKGFLVNLLEAFGAVLLLFVAQDWARDSLGHAVLLLTGVALLFRGPPLLMQVVWWIFPLRPALTAIFDGLVGYALLAVLLHFLL